MRKQWFLPITKVNEETREIEGVIALEKKDKQGEIMDYESSKEYFEKWSDSINKASGGKSFGNVREMHKPIAAGKVTRLHFDDENKIIRASTECTEDTTWEKIQKGVLNGFSIGGTYVERKRDKAAKAIRYTINPDEVSYVDNPAMYGADFEVIRADGEVEIRKFNGNRDVEQVWLCHKDCDLIHVTKEEARHCEGKVEKFNYANSDEEDDNRVEKGIYDISTLANNIGNLKWVEVGSENNKKKFTSALKSLFSVLKGMVADEKDAFVKSLEQLDVSASTVKAAGLEIINEQEEGDTQMKVVKKAAGTQEEEEIVDFDELTNEVTERVTKAVGKKLAKDLGRAMKTVVAEAVEEALEDMQESFDVLSTAVEKMAGKPKPSKAVTKAADSKRASKRKADDDDEEEDEKAPKVVKKTNDIYDPELNRAMKAALARPILVKDEPEDDDEDEDEDEDDE